MKTYDVVVVTSIGSLKATLNAEDNIPIGLLLQAVLTHQQLIHHLAELDINNVDTVLITSRNRLELLPGLTVVFHDGVNINGPIQPSPIYGVPKEYAGVQLTSGLRALVEYTVPVELDAL